MSLCPLFFVGCSEPKKREASVMQPVDKPALQLADQIVLDARLKDWAKGAVKVKAVVFDCAEGKEPLGYSSNRPLVKDGVEHPFIVRAASKYLNTTEVAELAGLLTGEHEPPSGAGCYVPHHGFIFYGADDSIVANIEVCLMCRNGRCMPYQGLAEHWDYEGLSKFIRVIGFPVFSEAVDWKPYFAKSKQRIEKDGSSESDKLSN